MTLAAKRHMGRVAALPCCVCGAQPVEVHHILPGTKAPASPQIAPPKAVAK